ncbi:MAG: hypothetical protein IPI97_04310 [Nitrosomonas sp.]|jgi:hypothetical protein|nr:hypothetical protein [Nitrosomonas sp.]
MIHRIDKEAKENIQRVHCDDASTFTERRGYENDRRKLDSTPYQHTKRNDQ